MTACENLEKLHKLPLWIAVAVTVAACEADTGNTPVAETDGWQGSIELRAARQVLESHADGSLNESEVASGSLPDLTLQPCYEDDEQCWSAEVETVAVSCSLDVDDVSRDALGERRTVMQADFSGHAGADVLLELDSDAGTYTVNVNFFGPAVPAIARHYRNGALETEETVETSACSFGHELVRQLPEDDGVLTGTEEWRESPWSADMNWHLERN